METWKECAQRVAYSNTRVEELGNPADELPLINAIDEQKWMPAGRHLWAAGLKKGFPINCFVIGWERGFSAHVFDLMVILSAGGGVGSNYSRKHTGDFIVRSAPWITYSVQADQLATVSSQHHNYNGFTDRLASLYRDSAGEGFRTVVVEDTREGWGQAFSYLLSQGERVDQLKLHFDLRLLRGEGASLKSSGGVASGPMPLAAALIRIGDLFRRKQNQVLDAVDLMEIDHQVACAAVMGNKRRSARMSILDWDDSAITRFLQCKTPGKEFCDHHTTNISVGLGKSFWESADKHGLAYITKAALPNIEDGIFGQGEPGLWNQAATKDRYNDQHFATNPCGEIGLPINGNCNLGHLVISNATSKEDFVSTAKLGTRFLLRATNSLFPTKQTEEVAKKERRIGLGLIGIAEWGRQRGISYSGLADNEELRDWVAAARAAISNEAWDFCFKNKIQMPATETTIAPTGTITNILKKPTSSGIEPYFAEAYIRSFYAGENTPPHLITDRINGIAEIGLVHEGAVENAYNLSLDARLPVHAFFQKEWCGGLTGNSISVTYNIPEPIIGDEAFQNVMKVLHYMSPEVPNRIKGFTAMPLKSNYCLPTGRKPIEPCSIEEAETRSGYFISDGCAGGTCEVRRASLE